jgi:hypothetical protein
VNIVLPTENKSNIVGVTPIKDPALGTFIPHVNFKRAIHSSHVQLSCFMTVIAVRPMMRVVINMILVVVAVLIIIAVMVAAPMIVRLVMLLIPVSFRHTTKKKRLCRAQEGQ